GSIWLQSCSSLSVGPARTVCGGSWPTRFNECFLANNTRFLRFYNMQSHELLREVFQKCSPKHVAGELGLSLSMIYKWAEPDDGTGSGTVNPLDRIEGLIHCTKDRRLVQWVCQRAGGFFILNPKINQPHPSFL